MLSAVVLYNQHSPGNMDNHSVQIHLIAMAI